MKIKCVLFDLDGTLLNTLDDLADSCNHAMHEMGRASYTREQICSFVGNGARVLCQRLVGENAPAEEVDRALSLFQKHYGGNMDNKTRPYDGIMELLSALGEMGVACAVVSNKYDAATKACCARYFPNLLGTAIGEGNGIRKKPNPDGPLRAMEILSAAPENTIYVGDSDVDIHTAQNTGLTSVGVTWGFRPRELLVSCGADVIVDSPAELLAYIRDNQ